MTPKTSGAALSAPLMLILTVAFVFAAHNATYWSIGVDIFADQPVGLAVFSFALACLTLGCFSPFCFRLLIKPFAIFLLILCAVTSYYMDTLGVVIDRDMIQNVVTTTVTESKHLITFGFVTHVLIYGIVPAVVVAMIRVKPLGTAATFAAPFAVAILGFGIAASLVLINYKTYASVLRERRDFLSSYQPGAPILGAFSYVNMITQAARVEMAPLGRDAVKGKSYGSADRPVLTVIVAGETARAQNFGLNGYSVQTTPELAERDVVNFTDVSSCGTATAVSLPCMFSNFTRGTYSYAKGVANENLLDVLAHAGFEVKWWDNNTGDKGIAARVEMEMLTHADVPEFCGRGECDDGIFFAPLKELAETIVEDTVVVLHMIGSHGPTYYLRYPEGFEKFTPACQTAEFKRCTTAEIVNAYDNTIAYTDYVLAKMIDMLGATPNVDASLFFVSDHGESLGESGIYLHGTPYFMAPAEQTQVPMVLWTSSGFANRIGLDRACLESRSDDQLSHDVLFHSVLGLLDVQTAVHEPSLDIFSGCTAGTKEAAE